ncbi:hypothetical protein CSB45_14520 [candidate division KSB3 bacterium]|uniref:Apple domain-containing protein n=1 Tax=candidate division KSB3 bacterium TaxID=2044937 RepID=A0A2G6E0Y9_9BACT|nr:MAG: hypothetical protein CSB45_14520 [candidate division KSB3 bacterium]PIE28415.1 MAG: hypothetical protein CSA57_13960 [candidate division KSB3 bacterium]
MKRFQVFFFLCVLMLSVPTVAEENSDTRSQNSASRSAQKQALPNFELVIRFDAEADSTAWEAEIFSLVTGSPSGKVSWQQAATTLQKGNYVFVLHFEEAIPEIPAKKPFTFSITDHAKTTVTLTTGRPKEPEMERGVGRTGADFNDSDPRQGRDYVNFKLAKNQAEECLARCKRDRNCDVYSYAELPEWNYSRCWLIHGAATAKKDVNSVSGCIQRHSSPYTVQILSTPLSE